MAKKYKLPKIEDLLDAGVHFGHQIRRWHPNMEPFIFTQRKGIHIIDLEITHEKLKEAADFLYEIALKGGQIIFVGTKRQAKDIIELEAKRCGALYVTERWIGGTITNYRVIRKNMDKLLELMRKKEEGEFDIYTKKERLLIDRQIAKLQLSVGGIVNLQGRPDALFIIDGRREKTAIRVANRENVPVVGLVDTNSDPTDIDYVVPGNDDAIRSIASVVKVIADAVEQGYSEYGKEVSEKKEKKEKKKDEKVEEKEVVKVSATEAPHSTEDLGKKHIKKAIKGENLEEEAENKDK